MGIKIYCSDDRTYRKTEEVLLDAINKLNEIGKEVYVEGYPTCIQKEMQTRLLANAIMQFFNLDTTDNNEKKILKYLGRPEEFEE